MSHFSFLRASNGDISNRVDKIKNVCFNRNPLYLKYLSTQLFSWVIAGITGMRPDFTCAPLGNESKLLFHSLHLVIKREVWKLIYRAFFI